MNLAQPKTNSTVEKKKDCYEILVDSDIYNDNEDYQNKINEKLIEAMKIKSFRSQLYNICKPINN